MMKINDKDNLWKIFDVTQADSTQKIDESYIRQRKSKKYNLNDLRLCWKILRDPYFAKAYKNYKSINSIIEAGFFDDLQEVEDLDQSTDQLNLLTTPLHKIKENISSVSDKELVVLLTTGGFSPIHNAHIEMMEIAKKEVEKRGKFVVGGYISPSHDDYVLNKYGDTLPLNGSYRVAQCQKQTSDHPWLMTDPWEAIYNKVPITYTDVIRRLEEYLFYHLKKKIKVVYVFGSDNAFFSRAFIKKGNCICVKRYGFNKKVIELKKDRVIINNPTIIISSQKTKSNISSTKIREKMKARLKQEMISNMKHSYLVRDDSSWALSSLFSTKPKKLVMEAKEIFLKQFIKALTQSFIFAKFPDKLVNSRIHTIDINSQQEILNLKLNKNFINLDNCTEGGFKVNISRLFELSDGQIESNKIISRPGYASLVDEIKKIPAGKYYLVDDDVASGTTISFIKSNLPKRVKIVDIINLSKIELKRRKIKEQNIFDVVDLRDFIIGARDGGLVVTLPNKQIARVPYSFPYVSPHSRAMIPASAQMDFSIMLWKLNVEFYKKVDSEILLKDVDYNFQKAMYYVGFSKNSKVLDICVWHINQLMRASGRAFDKNSLTLSGMVEPISHSAESSAS